MSSSRSADAPRHLEHGGDAAVLQVRDVEAGYGKLSILHGVTMAVQEKEIVALVGPNGAGKSTLAKVIGGVLTPTRGDIVLTRADGAAGGGIGYVPQIYNVFKALTVRENLKLAARPLPKAMRAESVEWVLDLFPIVSDKLAANAGSLSGGQRQLVAVAKALVQRPRLLVLDEPTAGLAPNTAEDFFGHIASLAESGIAALVVEQNVDLVLRFADYGYVLTGGQNRSEGTAATLRDADLGALFLS